MASGVRHPVPDDEDPLPSMRGSNVRRSPQARRSLVAHALKVSEDLTSSEPQMVGDVLEGDDARSELLGDPCDVRPEVTLILVSALLAGDAEGLARVAASDAVHDSTPRSSIEGSEITPDRSRIQPPFFHAADQYAGRIGFPLDVAHRARLEACSGESVVETSVEAADAGAD